MYALAWLCTRASAYVLVYVHVCLYACVCACVRACARSVCVCVRVRACERVRVCIRIVSTDTILRFINTLIIIIIRWGPVSGSASECE